LTDSFTRYKRKKAGEKEPQRPISASEESIISADLAKRTPEQGKKHLNYEQISKITSYGYPEDYIIEAMSKMLPNYCTAGYYLLEMDQNYC